MVKKEYSSATIYNGDCLEVLPTIESESIGFIITDMPYECSKSLITRQSAKNLNSDFGSWDKFFLGWISDAYRVLKNDSGMIVFVPAQRFETLMNACIMVGFEFIQPWFYHKKNPPPTFRRGLQWAVEHMIYVAKGKHQLRIENKGRCHNLFSYPSPNGIDRFHPTQKPIELMKDIIRLVSDKNDLILDCFQGSGSTGLAAIDLERRYIGIEKNKNYYEQSVKYFDKLHSDLFRL